MLAVSLPVQDRRSCPDPSYKVGIEVEERAREQHRKDRRIRHARLRRSTQPRKQNQALEQEAEGQRENALEELTSSGQTSSCDCIFMHACF